MAKKLIHIALIGNNEPGNSMQAATFVDRRLVFHGELPIGAIVEETKIWTYSHSYIDHDHGNVTVYAYREAIVVDVNNMEPFEMALAHAG